MQRKAAMTTRTVFRVVTFVCLCASLWRAPLPWLHCHEKAAHTDSAIGSMLTLNRHLDEWHSDDEAGESRMHLHFAMLDEILRGGGCPVSADGDDDEPPVVEHLVPPGQCVGPADLLFDIADVWDVADTTCFRFPSIAGRRSTSRQFLGDHAESHRLLTVLCVSRC
tara:strand:+ start:81 stop:578 length:498 start_codon:yes stop_codon:yes gene_type:complete